MRIVGKTDRNSTPGNFAATPSVGLLILPTELVGPLARLGVDTAEDLVAYVRVFPTAVAEALHWSVEDVARARAALTSQLRGLVDDDLLSDAEPEERVLGAFPPARLDK